MKKVLNWIKNHILLTIAIVIIIGIVSFILYYIHNSTHGGIYGNRCKDHSKYAVSDSLKKKVIAKYKEIEEVKSVDIYDKLCTIKIMIDIDKDVDLEIFKTKSTEVLSLFKKKQLKYYDFSLYINSEDEESQTYPINVTRHKSEADFLW